MNQKQLEADKNSSAEVENLVKLGISRPLALKSTGGIPRHQQMKDIRNISPQQSMELANLTISTQEEQMTRNDDEMTKNVKRDQGPTAIDKQK